MGEKNDRIFSNLRHLLSRFDIELVATDRGKDIPGSYWGAPEAGIVGNTVFVREDTPVHSALHETAHIVCMSMERRNKLLGDAGGSDLEEAAVCYLQVILAGHLPGVGSRRLMHDMDAWGYSFRLGSTARWYREDASDARAWLLQHGLIDASANPRWVLRR